MSIRSSFLFVADSYARQYRLRKSDPEFAGRGSKSPDDIALGTPTYDIDGLPVEPDLEGGWIHPETRLRLHKV